MSKLIHPILIASFVFSTVFSSFRASAELSRPSTAPDAAQDAVQDDAVGAGTSPDAVAHAAPDAAVASPKTGFFSTKLIYSPTRKRNTFWSPLVSVFLPGFDQWWEGQYRQAGAYTGFAVAGLLLEAHSGRPQSCDVDALTNQCRSQLLGSQMTFDAGLESAYASFRAAVHSRQANGQYLFLKHEETVDQLLAAPLAFREVVKPRIFIPLLIAGALAAAGQSSTYSDHRYDASDTGFAGGYSYMAGIGEESAFRGWLMPVFMENFESEFWSNTTTAALFSAAHLSSSNPVPWPQFLLGWYCGYLAQQNEWTLKQSIFVHTWWDVITFTGYYLSQNGRRDPNAAILLPVLSLGF